MMKVDEIRKSYLEFFKAKEHKLISSDSLVPQGDPTLLFTGAGMNQFKDYFLGLKKDYVRATSSQKCLRTGDLEEVGRTAFHHSFFEMLGNFSFGDYFKEEAILWAWEYLTQVLKIPAERLRVTVHKTDSESYKIWRDKVGVKESWIYKLGDKGNFWPANAPLEGPDGPCGPCSEIYYDQNPSIETEDIDSARFAEIWNLVFTQYNRQGKNNLIPLEQKNIDTGMGLERLACVLQGKSTNFEIDSFVPINEKVEALLKCKVSEEKRRSLYAISDHVRAVTFSIADGVIPSNEGRGYVIRKLIRRALWHAHQIAPDQKLTKAFLFEVVPTICQVMNKAYPELSEASLSIQTTIQGEEERFLDTLDTGLEILNSKLERLSDQKVKTVPGEIVFELYDTYGFPEELTCKISEEKGFKVNLEEFQVLMNDQRKKAKEASQISSSIFSASEIEKELADIPETKFLGYDQLEAEAKVLFVEIKKNEGLVVLDQTPFYAESGGQVGDKGTLTAKNFKASVLDTQKSGSCFLHHIKVDQGSIQTGEKVTASIDKNLRDQTMRNHTATHLLHAALRSYLGKQVRQLGSLVSPEKLRFDYSYSNPLTQKQLQDIENIVNAEILQNKILTKEEKSLEEAKKDGALAFFGEKYGEKVRVVSVGDFSKEFCGGTHCKGTGEIGAFIITSETSVASGTRRIEAVTGKGALDHFKNLRAQLASLAEQLKTSPSDLNQRIAKLQDSMKKLEREKKQGSFSRKIDLETVLKKTKPAGVFKFTSFKQEGLEMPELRKLADQLKKGCSQTVFLIAGIGEEKVQVLVGISQDLKKYSFDVRDLFKEISPLLQANGGGRQDMIQAGGPNNGQLNDKLWNKIQSIAVSFLKQTDIAKTGQV